MKIQLKNIDITKTSTMLKHRYYPETSVNEGVADKDKVFVECEYLKAGERTAFSKLHSDGSSAFDFKRIFAEKVFSIHNITLEDNKGNAVPITTASAFLELPETNIISELVLDIVLHIIKADSLTEDEIKNSKSDTNS